MHVSSCFRLRSSTGPNVLIFIAHLLSVIAREEAPPVRFPRRRGHNHQQRPDKSLLEVIEMERTSINPSSWSINLGFDQGELVEGHKRVLLCSGQDAMDAEGHPQHPG